MGSAIRDVGYSAARNRYSPKFPKLYGLSCRISYKEKRKKWAGLASVLPCRLVGHYVPVLSHSYLFLSFLLSPQLLSTLLCGSSVAGPSIILLRTSFSVQKGTDGQLPWPIAAHPGLSGGIEDLLPDLTYCSGGVAQPQFLLQSGSRPESSLQV